MRGGDGQGRLVPPCSESDRGQDQFRPCFSFTTFWARTTSAGWRSSGAAPPSDEEARALVRGARGRRHRQRDLRAPEQNTLAASNALRRFARRGLFSQQLPGSATWYQPTDPRLLGAPGGCLASWMRYPVKGPPLSSMPEGLSSLVRGFIQQVGRGNGCAAWMKSPGQLAARIGSMGGAIRRSRCANWWWSFAANVAWRAEELALLLGRKPETIRAGLPASFAGAKAH